MKIQHNPVFWTIGKDGNKLERNLENEMQEKVFTVPAYYNGENGIDDINYMYFENFRLFELYDSNGSDYERYGCKIEEGDTVVDIGGNIGMFSRRALERGASRVITFEPMSKAFSCLVDNVGYDVECYNIAIGKKTCLVNMCVPGDKSLGGSSTITEFNLRKSNHFDPSRNQEIHYTENAISMSLGELWDLGLLPSRINFLKIDCEGGEKEIIESLSDDHLSRIGKISMEYHASLLGNELREEFVQRAISLGFQSFTLFHGNGSLSQLHLWK